MLVQLGFGSMSSAVRDDRRAGRIDASVAPALKLPGFAGGLLNAIS
jgi:hypothetical protein